MLTRRLSLLGITAAFVLGACSSSGATTTEATSAPATEAATTTSVTPATSAPTTVAVSTVATTTPAVTTGAVNPATAALVSSALVAKTGGKLPEADATCIATGLLGKYDLSQLAALQSGPVSADVAAATALIIETCVGAARAVEVGTQLAGTV